MLLFFLSRQMVLRTWQAFFYIFFIFFLSNLVSEMFGGEKAIPFPVRSQKNTYNDSYPSPSHVIVSISVSIPDKNYRSGKDPVLAVSCPAPSLMFLISSCVHISDSNIRKTIVPK